MPTLNWIGKDKVVNHHQDVPFRILKHKYGFTEDGKKDYKINSGNLIIEGDNLEALKALLPQYEGSINCISIDPPYNTGTDGFKYKDKRILAEYPDGTEVPADHPLRHSYWLSFIDRKSVV